jgi:signal transduction histidine kinase/PAS domain-containing protein
LHPALPQIAGYQLEEIQSHNSRFQQGKGTEITLRQQAEEAIQDIKRRLQLTFESANTTIGETNLLTDRATLSNYFEQLFSLALGVDNATFAAFLKCVHPEDREFVAQSVTQAIQEKTDPHLRFRILSPDGSIHWVAEKGNVIYEEIGSSVRIVGVLMAISDRATPPLGKQVEQECLQLLEREQGEGAVREATRNLTTEILESITDGFFALDSEWRFTYLNFRAEQFLFRTKDELIDKRIWDEFPELANSNFDWEYHRAVADRVAVHFEELYPLLDTWLEVRAYPYQDGLSVYFRDVTAKKKAEAELLERSRLSTLEAEVGIALGQATTLSESLKRCTTAMVQHIDATFAGIWIFNQSSNNLELQAYAGIPDPGSWVAGSDLFTQQRLSLEGSLIGFVAQTRQPYITQDSGKRSQGGFESRFYSGQIAESCLLIPDTYFAGYPLLVEEQLVGIIGVVKSQPFSEAACDILGWVTNAIAIAIDRFWAREALSARREGLLFRLASQMRKSLDLNTILRTAVNEIQSLLQVDLCQYVWYFSYPSQPSLVVTHEAKANFSVSNHLAESSPEKLSPLLDKIFYLHTLRVDDVASDNSLDQETKALLSSLGITSGLLLPLESPHVGQRGAIICSNCSSQRRWSDNEVELLQAVVDQVAIAIDQAEIYAQSRAATLAAETQATHLEQALHDIKQTEALLLQTEKMTSLGQMVAGIAHEINNPLNFISGNLIHTSNYIQDLLVLIKLYQQHYPHPHMEIQQQLQEVDLEFLVEDLSKLLASMQIGADRIREIALSLRNFSRLDEADMQLVDIHQGIDSTLMILHNRLKPSPNNKLGIQVIKEYGNIPLLECYPGQLNQVFMNLISNAIDALESPQMQQSTPKIWISTEMSAGGNRVVIRIADNGTGMTPDVLKRLFHPFFTTKPVDKGTGLSLSISYQIVEKHGGILKCSSEPGQGSEFWIEIPHR